MQGLKENKKNNSPLSVFAPRETEFSLQSTINLFIGWIPTIRVREVIDEEDRNVKDSSIFSNRNLFTINEQVIQDLGCE